LYETSDSSCASKDDEEQSDDDDDPMQGGGEEEEEEGKSKKPPASSVIMDVSALVEGFEKNSVCMDCNGPVKVAVKHVCLASSFILTCTNKKCGYVYHSQPPAAAGVAFTDNRERTTDYAVNVLYVLGFMTSTCFMCLAS
jgi:hypothetical protein